MENYAPSETIQQMYERGLLHNNPGLAQILFRMNAKGYTASVDFGEGDEYKVSGFTVRRAIHEVEECYINFRDKYGRIVDTLLAIAGNDEEWLCDHTVSGPLDKIVDEVMYGNT